MKIQTSKHIYAHIDCDSFFASCEILRHKSWKYSYVCVGSEIIVAATYNAKKLWVKVGTPIWEARKILKNYDAKFCGVDIPYYKTISIKLMEYLRENTLDVRIFSIDEAFVDISWLPEMNNMDIDTYCISLQRDILRVTWVPVSIWVSNTRLKAKIFSKIHKPFWVCVWVDTQKERSFFEELAFREIPFIWSQTAKKLDYHISSIQDYIHLGYFEIVRRFGKNGGRIWLELRWVSSMGFLPKRIQKSIGRARWFNREMTKDPRILLQRIQSNCERICDELYTKWYEIRNISLLLIDSDWKKYRVYKDFEVYTSDRRKIFTVLKELFYDIVIPEKLYRKTWVFSSEIQSIWNKQLSLFQKENISHNKNLNVEHVFHEIEEKYGKGVVKMWYS